MAQRTAVWQIAADFSRARRESDKTARSLRNLNREREEFVEDSVEGDQELVASHKKHEKSVKDRVASLGRLAREQRKQSEQTRASTRIEESAIEATEESTAAVKQQEAAHRSAEGTLRRMIRTRKSHADAQRAEAMSSEAVVRAQERLQKVTLSNEKATLALEAAQKRLTAAQKKHGQDSEQYANALLSVQRRQNESASAAHRLTQATNAVNAAQQRAASGSGGLAGGLNRVAGGFFKGGGAAKLFGAAITAIKFSALISGLGMAAAGLTNLVGAALAVLGPLASVGAAVAALPAMLGAAVAGIGTIIGAFQGVGDAVKAGMEAQKAAGKEAKAVAKAERDSARQIVAAQRSLKQARQNVADTARNNAQMIRSANESVRDSEEALVDAHKAVAQARKDAQQQLEDYKESLQDLALQERGASLSVEEARRRLNETLIDPGADSLAKAQAQLAYDEALDRLDDVRKEQSKTRKDAAEAKRKGVEGSDTVQDALDAERDATENLRDAQESLADARRNAGRAAEDAAYAVKEAQLNLADAYAAQETAATDAATAQTKFEEALKSLSPEARTFVRLLLSMQDEMKGLRDSAARGLLPGLGGALATLLKLVPTLEAALFRWGQTLGAVMQKFADAFTTDPMIKMIGRLNKHFDRLLKIGGDSFVNIAVAIAQVMDAARPFTNWLARTVRDWTKGWRNASKDTEGVRAALDRAKWTLKTLGRTLKNVWEWFKAIQDAGGRKLGKRLLKGLEDITKGWEKWAKSDKGRKELTEWFETTGEDMSALGRLLGRLTRMFFDLGRKSTLAPILDQITNELVPQLERLLEAFQGDYAESMIDAITQIVELLADAAEGGGLGTFWDIIGGIADTLNGLPTGVLNTLVAALGTMAALKFTGLLKLAGVIGKIGKSGWKNFGPGAAAAAGEAGSTTIVGSSTDGGKRKGGKHRGTRRVRDDRGSIMLGGTAAKGGKRKAGKGSGDVAKDSTKAAKGMDKAGKSAGKMAGKVGGAVGVVGMLGMALSFLPGPIGDAAAKFGDIFLALAMVGPLLGGVIGWVGKVISFLGSGMAKIVSIVFKGLKFLRILMLANPWMLLITALVIVIVLIVKHWDKIRKIVVRAAEATVKALKGAWDKIREVFSASWEWVKKKASEFWGWIKDKYTSASAAVRAAFSVAWNKIRDIFSDTWGWIRDKASQFWTDLRTSFTDGADKVKSVFSNLKDGIISVWDKIREGVSAPVEFVVNTVINDGIIKNYNRLADLLPGISPIDEVHFGGFAKGGIPSASKTDVYPGYTPGKDIGFIGISGGEAIMRPEWTRAVGPQAIHEMNRVARTGGASALRKRFQGNFASGGIPASGAWSRHSSGYPWATWAGDINEPGIGDYGNPVRAYKDGTVAGVYFLGDRSYGRYIKINHADGSNTLYAHLSSANVGAGQQVRRGDMIGRVGDLGNASGPHLHFEIANGSAPVGVDQSGGGGWDLPGWAKKIVNSTAGWVGDKVNSGIDKLKNTFGNSPFVNMIAGVPKKLTDSLVSFIQSNTSDARQTEVEVTTKAPALSDNMAVQAVQNVASKFGWGSGAQWDALYEIISRESGWNPAAANPNSSARGLFQKMTSIHGPLEKTVQGQAQWGLNYIKSRYGLPTSALAFHNANGYYADGGIVPGVAGAAPVQMFARGGTVRGFGNRDTVPAMLTPGEFVVRKDAVERLGVSNLERLNQGATNRGKASSTQYFHQGGAVLGMQEGAKGKWVRGIERALGLKIDGVWDKAVTRLLKSGGASALRKDAKSVDMQRGLDKDFLNWLRGPLDKKGNPKKGAEVPTWGKATDKFKVNGNTLFGWMSGIMPQIERLPQDRLKKIMDSYKEFAKKFENSDFKALNEKLGLSGGMLTDDTRNAMAHVLDHTFGRSHGDFAYRPWQAWTPLEASIIQAEAQNAKVQQWQGALEQIATWGFESLLQDMLTKGMDDEGAFNTAIEAAGNQRLAKVLNDKLALLGTFSAEDFEKIIRMVGFFNSQAEPPGLRQVAANLGMSDYQTVMLYEKALKAGRFSSVAPVKRSRLDADIASWRAGTYYFNSGGQVPGVGSGDTVPAMLTPGEFVIKKEAAKALGLRNLWALNGVQKFNSGGLVMDGPDISRAPSVATSGVSASKMSAQAAGVVNNNITYDVDIHNPVAEKSTKSLTKALQRQSALRSSGGSGWQSVAGTSGN